MHVCTCIVLVAQGIVSDSLYTLGGCELQYSETVLHAEQAALLLSTSTLFLVVLYTCTSVVTLSGI